MILISGGKNNFEVNNILKSSLDHANNKNKPIKTSNSSDDELNSKGKDEMDEKYMFSCYNLKWLIILTHFQKYL